MQSRWKLLQSNLVFNAKTGFPNERISNGMQKCEITGKGKQFGHNVSFSQRRTKKVWKPNLQTKTIVVDGQKVRMKLSTQAIRTLKKKNLMAEQQPKTAETKK